MTEVVTLGECLVTLVAERPGPLADANVYRFSSKEYHAQTGFYYYGYRWYAPNLQRWMSRDPNRR